MITESEAPLVDMDAEWRRLKRQRGTISAIRVWASLLAAAVIIGGLCWLGEHGHPVWAGALVIGVYWVSRLIETDKLRPLGSLKGWEELVERRERELRDLKAEREIRRAARGAREDAGLYGAGSSSLTRPTSSRP